MQPSEFGIMAMAMVLVTFAHIFLDFGFYRAIVQQIDITQEQYSTVFFLNAGFALILTIVCFFLAAPLSHFYNQPLIQPVFRTLSVSFFLYGLNLVPSALLYKRLQFKLNSILTLAASFISGVAGVFMAYKGYGVWSLVTQTLLSSFLVLITNFVFAKWYPSLVFSWLSIKPLWNYGSRMFASGILDTLYTRLDTFIIGKIFSTQTLGYYARAQSTDNLVKQFSAGSVVGALFPYIAKHQNDRVYLKELFERYLHIIAFTSIGISGVLFLVAKPLFEVLFTARWLFSAELFRLMSIAGFAWPVSLLMVNIISGVGNSNAFFRLEIYKRIIALPVYLFGFIFGLEGFLICMVVLSFAGVSLNAWFVSKELDMSWHRQWRVIFYYFFLGVGSVFITHTVLVLVPKSNSLCSVAVLTVIFSSLYLLGAYFFNLRGVKVINLSFQKLKTSAQ